MGSMHDANTSGAAHAEHPFARAVAAQTAKLPSAVKVKRIKTRPVALITGASSGIGADLARELADDEHDLVLVARNEEPLEALAVELRARGADVRVMPFDLSAPGAAVLLFEQLEDEGEAGVDVLVNNAGIGYNSEFAVADSGRLQELMQLNMIALTELTRAFVPGMVARGRGRVLFVSSLAGFLPGPGAAVYHASKAYVLSLGQAIAYELRHTAVTVTVLCPGATRTGYAEAASATRSKIVRGSMMAPTMLPEAVARIGYAALKRGTLVVVTGARNKMSAFATRLLPRPVLLGMSADLNSDS